MTTRRITDWIAIEGAYRAGRESLRQMAARFGITEGAIRLKAKQRGWLRDPEGTKRAMVKDRISGAQPEAPKKPVKKTAENVALMILDAEATYDVQDMHRGLAVARACLVKLEGMVEMAEDPKDIKTIVEANRLAIETIRRIRGLDDTPEGQITVTWAGV